MMLHVGRFRPWLLATALLLAGCQPPAGFVEGTRLGVIAHHPKQFQAIFLNTHTGDGLDQYPDNIWTTVDVSAFVPPDTRAVYLSGLLIITHGSAEEICDLTLAYRTPGASDDPTYVAQTIEATAAAGVRTPHSIWVPAPGGKFQIKWQRSTGGDWPDHCSYGINLNLVGYLR